jgi:hypothetical protein
LHQGGSSYAGKLRTGSPGDFVFTVIIALIVLGSFSLDTERGTGRNCTGKASLTRWSITETGLISSDT